MARPIKKGLDYGIRPVNWNIGKMEYITSVYGMLGASVIMLSILPRLEANGYYIEYNERSAVTFSREFENQLDVLSEGRTKKLTRWEMYDEIVNCAIEEGVFCKTLFEKYGILTSIEQQEFYVKAKEKATRVEIDKRYLLLNDAQIPNNVEIIEVSGEKIRVSSPENTQSKAKERKLNKSKPNESSDAVCSAPQNTTPTRHKYGEYKNVFLSDEELEKLKEEFPNDWKRRIERLSEYMASSGKSYKNHLATIRKWARSDVEKRTEKKGKGINNYNDSNKPDYSNFSEEILAEMLGEEKE